MNVIYKECDKATASLEHLEEGDFSRVTKSDKNLYFYISDFLARSENGIRYEASWCDHKGFIQILNLKNDGIIYDAIIHSANECCEYGRYQLYEQGEEDPMMPGESAGDIWLTAQYEINTVMVEIVNWIKTEIEDRSVRLQDLKDRFSFLLNLNSIVNEGPVNKKAKV